MTSIITFTLIVSFLLVYTFCHQQNDVTTSRRLSQTTYSNHRNGYYRTTTVPNRPQQQPHNTAIAADTRPTNQYRGTNQQNSHPQQQYPKNTQRTHLPSPNEKAHQNSNNQNTKSKLTSPSNKKNNQQQHQSQSPAPVVNKHDPISSQPTPARPKNNNNGHTGSSQKKSQQKQPQQYKQPIGNNDKPSKSRTGKGPIISHAQASHLKANNANPEPDNTRNPWDVYLNDSSVPIFHPPGYISITEHFRNKSVNDPDYPPQLIKPRIAFVTAIVGDYEATCKKPVPQTIPADFIVYTNHPSIETHGVWKIVDINTYQFGINERDRNKSQVNSLVNNQHTFNRAKFVKVNLHRLPELKEYDVLVWMDGAAKIINPMCAELVYDWLMNKGKNIMIYANTHKNLQEEAKASHMERYTSTYWHKQSQPFQDIDAQIFHYVNVSKFEDQWYLKLTPQEVANSTGNIPSYNDMFNTCFVAFNMQDPMTSKFFDAWYEETLNFTTQDQISFVFVLFKLKLLAFNSKYPGFPTQVPFTQFIYKGGHGQRIRW
jgi:hypothetical protein